MTHQHRNGCGENHTCDCKVAATSTQQTLDELEFERGIWSAALHYAARSGNKEAFHLLLNAGADINARTNGGVTPLHRAAMMGRNPIVEMLIERYADSGLLDEDGRNALHRAAQNGHLETARLLLAYNERLKSQRDKRGATPFDLTPSECTELRALLKHP